MVSDADLTVAQRLALALDRDLSVIAGAGTGKTQVLTRRYLRILENLQRAQKDPRTNGLACGPERIAAVTFTRKAAGEMRERINRRIGERVETARAAGDADGFAFWTRMRRRLAESPITTLDGLAAEIVRDNALLVERDPDSRLLDDAEQEALVQEAIAEALAALDAETSAALRPMVVQLGLRQVHKTLRRLVMGHSFASEWADQMEALDVAAEWRRLRREAADFTPAEARERLQRVWALVAPWCHAGNAPPEGKAAAFLTWCRRLETVIESGDEDAVLDAYAGLIKRFQKKGQPELYVERSANHVVGPKREWKCTGDDGTGAGLFVAIRRLIVDHGGFRGLPGQADLELLRQTKALARAYRDADRRYDAKKRRRSAFDYGDLQRLAARLLDRHGAVAEELRQRFDHLLVDEFQDTNHVQWDLVKALAVDPLENMGPVLDIDADDEDDEGFTLAADLFADEDPELDAEDVTGSGAADPSPVEPVLHELPDEAQEEIMGRDRLFIVGDAKQSIYAFRGAEVRVYQGSRDVLKRTNDLHGISDAPPRGLDPATGDDLPIDDLDGQPEAQRGEVSLDTNFRSLPNLVAFANHVFDHVLAPRLGTDHRPFEAAPGPLHASRPPLAGVEAGQVELLVTPDKPSRYRDLDGIDGDALARMTGAEAASHRLAERIAAGVEGPEPWLVEDSKSPDGHRSATYADVAILLQARTHLKTLERALAARGVPYVVASGRGLWQRVEIWDQVNVLSFLVDTYDDVALAGLLRSAFFAWTDDAVVRLALEPGHGALWNKLQQVAAGDGAWRPPQGFDGTPPADVVRILQDARDRAGADPTHTVLRALHEQTAYPVALANDEQPRQSLANVQRFLRILRDREERLGTRLPELLRDLKARIDDDADEPEADIPEGDGAVRILTVHAAKGLEFPIVCLADMGRTRTNKESVLLGRLEDRCLVTSKVRDDEGRTTAPYRHRILNDALTEEAAAEHQRLYYVALTRARDHLVLGMTTPRFLAEKPEQRQPKARTEANDWASWTEDALGLDADQYDDAWSAEGHVLLHKVDGSEVRIDTRPPNLAPRFIRDDTASNGPIVRAPHVTPPRSPIRIHPSALETYQECPARFRYRHIDGLPDLRARSLDLEHPDRGRLLGAAVHRVLETTHDDEPIPDAVRARIAAIATEHGQDAEAFIRDVQAHVERARAAMGTDTAPIKELVVDHAWQDGIRSRGVIDRLLLTANGPLILDTKADRPGQDLVDDAEERGYAHQLRLYQAMVSALTSEDHDVPKPRLVYTSTGQTVDIAPDDTITRIRSALVHTRDAGPDESAWPRSPDQPKRCQGCGFHRRWGGPCAGADD